jgi:hypothetical protein
MFVFPSWSDSLFRVAIGIALLTGLLAIVLPMVYVRSPFHERRGFPVDQPVQFDHRHHVRDDGINCLYCHGNAAKGAYAGIPSTEKCMGCHAQVWPDSIQLEPVRRSYFSGKPLQWNRVHHLPDYVYFNHSVHVRHGVQCKQCHGAVEEMALVYQVAPLSMSWCLDCHRQQMAKGARNLDHCTTCHR